MSYALHKFETTLEALCWAHNQQGGTIHQFCNRYGINWCKIAIRAGRSGYGQRELFIQAPGGGTLVLPIKSEYRRGCTVYSCAAHIASTIKAVRTFAPQAS